MPHNLIPYLQKIVQLYWNFNKMKTYFETVWIGHQRLKTKFHYILSVRRQATKFSLDLLLFYSLLIIFVICVSFERRRIFLKVKFSERNWKCPSISSTFFRTCRQVCRTKQKRSKRQPSIEIISRRISQNWKRSWTRRKLSWTNSVGKKCPRWFQVIF